MSGPTDSAEDRSTPVGGVVLAWLAAIGIDFFAYGAVFAGLFTKGDPAVLTAQEIFNRIPAGYASFLIEIVLLLWLMRLTSTTEPADAVRLGGLVGLGFGAALVLGVWSFSPIPLVLLLSWWLVLVIQMAVDGWVLAAWQAGERRKVGRTVALLAGVSVVVGVVVQNLGSGA